MKVITYEQKCSDSNIFFPSYFEYFNKKDKLLFFDIETTGFAPKNTTLYLIGALWFDEDTIKIQQWFNEDGYSEKEILATFDIFSRNFTHLVHFNGLGFDLPYLKQKAELLEVPFVADQNLSQIDIYKEIRSYQKIFGIDNMKQISIEQYLGIKRQDNYSGKELIHMYQKYVAKPDQKTEELLLLHNHDDLLGMPQISKILNYKAFFEALDILTLETKIDEKGMSISFSFDFFASLPNRISLSKDQIYLNGIDTQATLYIPIIQGTLKHYFPDYKNYYYLPDEDMAIHKSVARFVDPDHREKAKKDTCYIKKQDYFIPYFVPNLPKFYKDHCSDKKSYQTLESFQSSDDMIQKEYIKNTLQIFL